MQFRNKLLIASVASLLIVGCSNSVNIVETDPKNEPLVLEEGSYRVGERYVWSFALPLGSKERENYGSLKKSEGILLDATFAKKDGVPPPCTQSIRCRITWETFVNSEPRPDPKFVTFGSWLQVETGKAMFTFGPVRIHGLNSGDKVTQVVRLVRDDEVLLVRIRTFLVE